MEKGKNKGMEDYLSNVQPTSHEQDQINKYLSTVQSLFEGMEVDSTTESVSGVEYVSVDDSYQGTVTNSVECQYSKSSNMKIIGAWASKTCHRQNEKFIVDIAIEMPKSLVEPKDDVNFKYVIKRNYYLKSFCSQFGSLLKIEVAVNNSSLMWYGTLLNEPLDLIINFHINLPVGVLQDFRLLPTRNNIRFNEIPFEQLPATPNYNALISRDIYNIEISQVFASHSDNVAFQKAVILLKSFVYRKKLDLSSTAVQYLCHLVVSDSVSQRSPIPIVKSVLKRIANSQHFVVADKFVTISMENKSLDSIPINRFEYLKQQSEFMLKIMDIDQMSLVSDLESWDYSIPFSVPTTIPSFYNVQSKLDIFDYNIFLKHALERLIQKACAFIKIIKIDISNDTMMVNVQCNVQPSTLIRGPPIHAKEANLFMKLWGNNCQQRKFKDGFVSVCISFESNDLHEILLTLLSVHLPDITTTCIPRVSERIESLDESADLALFNTLQQLELPLQITHVHAINMDYFALELETSMSWPDNLIVMQSTKLLYLTRIYKLLPDRYTCRLVDHAFLKRKNPFSMHQQLHITDTATGKIYKMMLLVDREIALLEKEMNSNGKQVDYPALDVPEHILQSNLNVELLKRKAGDYNPIDCTALISDATIAYTYIKQTILHTREVKRCISQYPLFRETLKMIKSIFNKQGVLGFIQSNEIIDFNAGHVNYMERYVERMTISVFVHSYPFSHLPMSVNSAIERIFYKIKTRQQSYYDMDGEMKLYIDESNYMVKTPLDISGTWFMPYKVGNGLLKTYQKELIKACKWNFKEKKVLMVVENAREFERLLNRIYPQLMVIQTDKENKVFSITSKANTMHENMRDLKRLSKTCH